MNNKPLGRIVPSSWEHVAKYPFSAIAPQKAITVEKKLSLPRWHWSWDQGSQGACVGFGTSMMMSILNKNRYDPFWLWDEAKKIDEWPDTNPGDQNGTSVRAGCDVLRAEGHVKVVNKKDLPVNLAEGILANRWAVNIDEMRTAISMGLPISFGINWYSNFDNPKKKGREYWIGEGDLGSIRGGHCVCIYGASDKKQAFLIKNSWGKSYPLVWMPYKTAQKLLDEQGESALVTDR